MKTDLQKILRELPILIRLIAGYSQPTIPGIEHCGDENIIP
jgi:hypothetical protein